MTCSRRALRRARRPRRCAAPARRASSSPRSLMDELEPILATRALSRRVVRDRRVRETVADRRRRERRRRGFPRPQRLTVLPGRGHSCRERFGSFHNQRHLWGWSAMARLFLSAVIGLLVVMPAPAATWADSLFDNLAHDFGVVARGPTVSHSFRIANTTGQPVHISSIRVSCGCTSAGVRMADLPPGESTDLVAQMDTRRFVGPKSVTIYVQFDRPQWEEVRLTVTANGRDD